MVELLQQKEEQTIVAIKAAIVKKGFWQMADEQQKEVLQSLLTVLNKIWGTQVTLMTNFNNPIMYRMTGGGTYHLESHQITLYKASLMTFLHEFGHALHERAGELPAINWSHRMFQGAMPRVYQNSLEEGKFFSRPVV